MVIGSCKVYLMAEWVNSLKEKRMVVKSIIEKARRKFNISIAEVENQDLHKNIALGFCCVTNDSGHADSIIRNVLDFIESNTDATVYNVEIEIL